MRQLLLRVPDELHARLSRRASDDKRSVNSLATEILERALPADDDMSREAIRERARALGVLVELDAPAISDEEREAAIESTRGIGPILDELWKDGR